MLFTLNDNDRELAETLFESLPSTFLYPESSIRQMAASNTKLFFRCVAPKYGFDPDSAKWAGDREHPSWDIEAMPAGLPAGEADVVKRIKPLD